MIIKAVDEYNEQGHMIYAENFPGAFVRGKTREEALLKFDMELTQYAKWLEIVIDANHKITITQEKVSDLQIHDADTDVIFESERAPLSLNEYESIKTMALKSAQDFLTLYNSIPNKTGTTLSPRKTFYGDVPITAQAMYEHTKNVNCYYFGEIQVDVGNEPDILTCRKEGFQLLEKQPNFLHNSVFRGSYDEEWSLRKVCRRFVWHDRIHAKAMYKMTSRLCGTDYIKNSFVFQQSLSKPE